MRILIISPKNKTIINFRADLIKDMISNGNDVFVVGPNKDFISEVMDLGVKKFIEIPLIKDNTSISGDLTYFFKLKKYIKEISPDIVFSYTIKPIIYGSIAAKCCRVGKIYSMVTGLGRVYASENYKARLLRLLTKRLYRIAFYFSEKVIFQNPDDVKDFVKDKYLPEEKCIVVNGSGVNMSRFKYTDIPSNPVFLMVSRIIKEKGVLDFAQAASIVKRQVPNSKFILLGAYDNSIGAINESDLHEYIEKGIIELPGEVKDPVSFYQKSSIFVLPSYYREGLPRTILEAMSCGRAVITTDWIGCREPIIDGINGYLVPVKKPEILAEKMLVLAKDRNKVLNMGKESIKICKEKYDVEIVNKQMRKILDY